MRCRISSPATLWIIPSLLLVWAGTARAGVNEAAGSPSAAPEVPQLIQSSRPPPAAWSVWTIQPDPGRQVVSLWSSPPPSAPNHGTRQRIDLRAAAGIGSDPSDAIPAAPVSVRTEESSAPPAIGSQPWVDLVIPNPFFHEAGQPLPPEPGLQPTDRSTASSPAGATETAGDQPQSAGSAVHAAPLTIAPPSNAPLSIGPPPPASEPSDQPLPKPNFTPDQAIPDWIHRDAGQPPSGQAPPDRPSATLVDGMEPGTPNSRPLDSRPLDGMPSELDRHSPGLVDDLPRPQPAQSTAVVPRDPLDPGSAHSAKLLPEFAVGDHRPPLVDAAAGKVDYQPFDFLPSNGPVGSTFDPMAAESIYRGKFAVPVQRPLIELWRPLYTSGIYPPAKTWFGETNPMKPHFLVYGDMRTAIGANRNAAGASDHWGNVLNLDMDLQLTSTERLHAFVSPLNRGTQATGVSFHDELDFLDATNFNLITLFFEGDLGALVGGARGQFPSYDLPFTLGLIPLVYQNGIWANDAVLGAACALPARHNRWLQWSNFDATFFWATDNVTSDAFPGQDSAADFFGTAWFIDAYDGYIEADYAFVNDNTGAGRSYHNVAVAFTRRYWARISNSVRMIVNLGQHELPRAERTADGSLLLIENSWITPYPNTVVPYLNLFYGQGRPQSLARAGIVGGILNNTGINFETDGITGYPTLDATAHNTFGLAAGINLLASQFAHQLVLEFAMLQATGPAQLRNAEGDQYAVGMRYQKPLSHRLIFRTDHMVGVRENARNLNGSRFEFRWKF